MRRATVFFVLALTPSAGFAQQLWHVDVDGTPPGTGTASDPCTSVQYAIDQASTQSGDTLLLAPGRARDSHRRPLDRTREQVRARHRPPLLLFPEKTELISELSMVTTSYRGTAQRVRLLSL